MKYFEQSPFIEIQEMINDGELIHGVLGTTLASQSKQANNGKHIKTLNCVIHIDKKGNTTTQFKISLYENALRIKEIIPSEYFKNLHQAITAYNKL